jgi:hypothetical protein
MTDKEFWEYVEIEGLEYFLNFKTDAWHNLFNPELLQFCHEYVAAFDKINQFNPNK